MTNSNSFTIRFASFIQKYRWLVFIGTMLLGIGIGGGAANLKFDGDYHAYFSESNPQLEAFDNLQEKYTKDESVIIALSPKDKNVFTKSNLMAIKAMTEDAWQIPYNSRVDAITNYQHTKAEDDDLYVADLAMDLEEMTASEIEELKNANGQESSREMKTKTLEMAADGDKSLIIFESPRDVKGTAMLTFSHKTESDDQWLFLPSIKRVKRISSNNKSGPFMGSEIAYEDLGSQ